MDDIGRARVGRAALALILALSHAPAQAAGRPSSDGGAQADRAEIRAVDQAEPESTPNGASDLLIATRDASGRLGAAIPLTIKLVRVRNVSIEAIKLLGLPRGVTISDSTNMFESSSDNNDVDVSTWDLSKIRITQSDQRENSFSLAVAAIWTPESGGHIDVTSSRLTVSFRPDGRDAGIGSAPDGPERLAARILPAPPVAEAVRTEPPVAAVPVPDVASAAPPASPEAADRPAPAVAAPAESDRDRPAAQVRPVAPPRAAAADPLVERAKALIRLGDISGARLLLERAQARDAPNATFLLAQTWDPAMLRAWKVHGLRADPDRARSLYAKAAGQERGDEQRLAATGR
jgi:hypothetical protein